MKTIKLKLSNEYEVRVPDDYDLDKDGDHQELFDLFSEQIAMNNEDPATMFWESLDLKQ